MSLNEFPSQDNPETPYSEKTTLQTLNDNRRSVHRWFWKAYLAFNLILGSIVFWTVYVPSLV